MRAVSRYDDLAPLISAQLHRGVRTNAFFSREGLEGLISRGALFLRPLPSGLLLLVRRPEFYRLHFYLNDLSLTLDGELPGTVVCEIPFRPRDTALRETAPWLCSQGFSPLLARVRLSRPAGPAPEEAIPLQAPDGEDRALLWTFLREMFPPLTGCIPTLEEFSSEHCLFWKDEAGVGGLIHFTRGRRGGEIRHLAVRPDLRGRGLSRALIAGCLRALEGGGCTVWTGRDNQAALRAYQSAGFQPDGWESTVLGTISKTETR